MANIYWVVTMWLILDIKTYPRLTPFYPSTLFLHWISLLLNMVIHHQHTDILNWMILFCGACLVHCRVLSTMPALSLLDANSTALPGETIKDISRISQMSRGGGGGGYTYNHSWSITTALELFFSVPISCSHPWHFLKILQNHLYNHLSRVFKLSLLNRLFPLASNSEATPF